VKQERFVVMLPLALKRRLKSRAADAGLTMRSFLIWCLEQELGDDWDEPAQLPGTQRLLEAQ
jgi:hypothetical protein